MRKLKAQGVHHVTLVGADQQISQRLSDPYFRSTCRSSSVSITSHVSTFDPGVTGGTSWRSAAGAVALSSNALAAAEALLCPLRSGLAADVFNIADYI
jgi:hypothetical protein